MNNVFAMWRLGFDMARLGTEANMVIWMRMIGMAGAWNVLPSEDARMWSEKPAAFADAMGRGLAATMGGKDAVGATSAALKPLTRKATSNRRRLARRGLAS